MVKDFSFTDDYFIWYIDQSYLAVYSSPPLTFISKLSQSFSSLNDSSIIDTTQNINSASHTASYPISNPAATSFSAFTFPDITDTVALVLTGNTI